MATIVKNKNAVRKYTVRYYHEGKQREKSFRTSREANDFKAKFEHDSRERIFVDPRTANTKFATVAADWLSRHPGKPKTKVDYEGALRLHILPVFGTQGLAKVAGDRDAMETFLAETLPGKGLGPSMIRTCAMVINAIVNDAIRGGKLNQNQVRIKGIRLPAVSVKTEIAFASNAQIRTLAAKIPEPYGFTIYLMRGCGLRLGEALGWEAGDFLTGGTLRVQRQLSADGTEHTPLKHREEDDYRDIPAPGYVLMAPEGLGSFPRVSHRQYRDWFNRARDAAGLPAEFTPHTLRHIFASNCLAGGIPITDVSKWLGHKNIQVTYGIYGHLVPASWTRARGVLDEEWES